MIVTANAAPSCAAAPPHTPAATQVRFDSSTAQHATCRCVVCRALTSPRAGGVVSQMGTTVSGRSYAVNLTALLRTLRQRQLDAALR